MIAPPKAITCSNAAPQATMSCGLLATTCDIAQARGPDREAENRRYPDEDASWQEQQGRRRQRECQGRQRPSQHACEQERPTTDYVGGDAKRDCTEERGH